MQKAIFFLVFLITAACTTTTVQFKAMAPSEITIPPHVRTILLVNRSEPAKKGWNMMEGLITGEFPGQDKHDAEIALNGVQTVVDNGPRLKTARFQQRLKGSGNGYDFPEPMNWDSVTAYCRKYNCEALIALETYDGDFDITNSWKDVEKVEFGKKVVRREYYAQGVAKVELGFRLYDTLFRVVGLQESYYYNRSWNTYATSKAGALLRLISRYDALTQLSQSAGNDFGLKITPHPVTVSRVYYTKYKKDTLIARGVKQAQSNDWDAAITSWKLVFAGTDINAKARAAYNIAVGYEIKGDLHSALVWAQSALIDFKLNYASQYISQLEQRIVLEEKLNEQMELPLLPISSDTLN